MKGAIDGNFGELFALQRVTSNPDVRFCKVAGADHFSMLFPATRFLVHKVLADTGEKCNIDFQSEELEWDFK